MTKKTLLNIPKEQWIGIIMTFPFEADYKIISLNDEEKMATLENIEIKEIAKVHYNILRNRVGVMCYIKEVA